jgi:hypothetical protein
VTWITLPILTHERSSESLQLPSVRGGEALLQRSTSQMEINMFRKLALVAVASISIASLSAPAFAFGPHFGGGGGGIHMGHMGGGGFGGGHFGGHFHGGGFFRGGVDVVGYSCYRTVWTDFGPRRVYVCD